MTLRVTLEIVPHGQEDKKYPIYEVNIHNMGRSMLGDYKYDFEVGEYTDEMGEHGPEKIYTVEGSGQVHHVRRDGALELARKVIDEHIQTKVEQDDT